MSTALAESTSIESLIKAQAYSLGFDLVGITALGPMQTSPEFEAWVARGCAGDMDYLPRSAEKRKASAMPRATASPWRRVENFPSASTAWPNVWPRLSKARRPVVSRSSSATPAGRLTRRR